MTCEIESRRAEFVRSRGGFFLDHIHAVLTHEASINSSRIWTRAILEHDPAAVLHITAARLDTGQGAYALAAAMALMTSMISGLSEAPPTRKPSMSGLAERSGAVAPDAEPP